MRSLARLLSGSVNGKHDGEETVLKKENRRVLRANKDEAERDTLGDTGDTLSQMPQKGYKPTKHEPGGKVGSQTLLSKLS